MSQPWKCSQCKIVLGTIFAERIHIKRQELEAILRQGEVTLSCPVCRTLNELVLLKEPRNGQAH